MGENELIKKVIAREERAINYFCRQYRPRLERVVGRKVGDRTDVEEIVQDTLMSAIDGLPAFKRQSSLLTWVCGIARHEIADFYRRRKIKQIVFSKLPWLETLVSEALGPELAYQELETKRRILESLKDLSEGYALVLRLKYIEGLSMKEIAKKLNVTVKAVESRLSRARLAFRKVYNEKTGTETTRFFEEMGEDWSSFSS